MDYFIKSVTFWDDNAAASWLCRVGDSWMDDSDESALYRYATGAEQLSIPGTDGICISEKALRDLEESGRAKLSHVPGLGLHVVLH